MNDNTPRRGWRKNNNRELQNIYEQICETAFNLGLIENYPPLYLFKSSTCWGRANCGRHYIGLNEVYLQDPQKAVKTICHEIAHLATPYDHHGEKWRKAFHELGELYGVKTYGRCASEAEIGLAMPKRYAYEVYCPHCGKTWKFERKTGAAKTPENYTCNICKSGEPLKVRKI